ncbi:hypothetical protein ZWY2020_028635 [Hordeum vulgare]|nr:hypothetical protein ZWY2020_028635 [Hordeum vulgare]
MGTAIGRSRGSGEKQPEFVVRSAGAVRGEGDMKVEGGGRWRAAGGPAGCWRRVSAEGAGVTPVWLRRGADADGGGGRQGRDEALMCGSGGLTGEERHERVGEGAGVGHSAPIQI